MIAMKCPACGADGRVPKNKVNARLVCKKCLKVFHLTTGGKAVLGPPPEPSASRTAPVAVSADRTSTVDQFLERLPSLQVQPRTLAVLGGLGLVALAWFWFSRNEPLSEVAQRAAQATMDGDLTVLRGLASSGTTEEVLQWYQSVRPKCDALRSVSGGPPTVGFIIMKEEPQSGIAEVQARYVPMEMDLTRRGSLLPDPTVLASGTRAKILEIPMRFTVGSWGDWKLDGKRTLETTFVSP
jgi:hypothetical protein